MGMTHGEAACDAENGNEPEASVPWTGHEEWAAFYGGPDPDNCAGADVYGDETDAREDAQWRVSGGVARRAVRRYAWVVVQAPGEDEPGEAETAAILADPETMAAIAEGEGELADDGDLYVTVRVRVPREFDIEMADEVRWAAEEWVREQYPDEGDDGECGHEFVLGDVAYRCERKPHPVDGYGSAFRHAAGIDEQHAKGTEDPASDGPATLVTWGEDGQGDGQDWAIAWGALADYGTGTGATGG